MSDADIAAQLTEALTTHAGAGADLVSINLTISARAEIADVDLRTDRTTRTLMFLSAEARDRDGAIVASASSVHRVRA